MTKKLPTWVIKARSAMKDQGITFKQMGQYQGISESAVSHQLNGKRGVTVRQIRIYAEVLGMSLSELVGEDAVFVSDQKQLEALELFKDIPKDQQEIAIKMLQALTKSSQKQG